MFRPPVSFTPLAVFAAMIWGLSGAAMAENIPLQLRSIESDKTAARRLVHVTKNATWEGSQTAVIVCDVWDYHHCLNAVRRLEEFASRLDQVLKTARMRGAIIIHAPSDCMPAYADHPARQRALQTPKANPLPPDIALWCSQLPRESGHQYPIDQSDGGEDDDPQEHAVWAAKLKALGRNPGMPWKKQSDLITIDGERDYISDRGDEVWNILEQRGIKNVILTGVHCNMCVLGRPFGLRQMVRNKKQVVLIRDMTDSMYSPKSWPFVDHFTGHDLVLDYVEQTICASITSDQLLGGESFHWKADQRPRPALQKPAQYPLAPEPTRTWINLQNLAYVQDIQKNHPGVVWYRGALHLREKWTTEGPLSFSLPDRGKFQVWLNGHELRTDPSGSQTAGQIRFLLAQEHTLINDYNLVVIKTDHRSEYPQTILGVRMNIGSDSWGIDRGWQVRIGDNPSYSNIPLPAKFGIGPDAVLQLSGMKDAF